MAATEVSEVTGPSAAPRHRRRRGSLSTYLLLSPTVVVLLAFFVAPLYYVFLFSTGQRYQGVTKAAALINGELTSFSWDRWRELLGTEVTVSGLGLSPSMPLWVLGLIAIALLTGALRGARLPRFGREVMVGSLVLLVVPFLTLPVGTSVARLVKITSENPSITLFFRSISTSLTVSVVAVLMAFPVAYYLAFCRGKSKYTWLVIVIAPFLTSYLLRVLAFKVILTDDGLVNTALFDSDLRADGNQVEWLLYTQFTVLLVLLYAWVPFVTLPIFVALENMDRRLLEAATDLGASRLRAFVKITLPIAAPGIVAAFLFVFIPTIGEFVTPQLVGGSKGYLFGSAIADDFGQNSDWQIGRRARALPDGRRARADGRDLALPARDGRWHMSSPGSTVAVSRNGRRLLTGWFVFFLIFLYLPSVILLIFSFNSGTIPVFPLQHFTTKWYSDAWHDQELRDAFVRSIKVARRHEHRGDRRSASSRPTRSRAGEFRAPQRDHGVLARAARRAAHRRRRGAADALPQGPAPDPALALDRARRPRRDLAAVLHPAARAAHRQHRRPARGGRAGSRRVVGARRSGASSCR